MEATLARPVDFEALLDFCISKSQETRKGDFIVEGFASTSDLDLQGHVVTPAAIKASAKDLEKNSTVLDNHDPNKRVGVVLKSEARPGGLWIQVRISETVPDIRKQIEEGVLNKFSIRGQIVVAEPKYDPDTGKRILIIHKMYLTHVATVSVPANTDARSLTWYIVKALGGEIMPEKKPEETGKDNNSGKEPEIVKTDTPAAAAETPKPEVEKAKDDATKKPAEQKATPEAETKPTETVKADAPAKVDEFAKEDLILKAELTADGYKKVVALLDKILANLGDKAMATTLAQQIKAMLGRVSGAAAAYPYPTPAPASKAEETVTKGEEKVAEKPAEKPAEKKPEETAAPTEVEKTLGSVVETVGKLAAVVGEMQKMMPGSSMRKAHIDTGGKKPETPASKSPTDIMGDMQSAVDDMLQGR